MYSSFKPAIPRRGASYLIERLDAFDKTSRAVGTIPTNKIFKQA